MTTRTRNALGLLAIAAVLAAAWVLMARPQAAPTRPAAIDLVPQDAKVVVSANLARIRQSAFGRFLRSDAIDSAGGTGSACDRDALDRAAEVAVWVPGDTPGQFGIAAVGTYARDELVGCSRTTIAKRGGHPSVATEGEWIVVGDDDLGPDAARIAAREDGVLLLGRPSVRTRMAAVAAGWSPSAAKQGEHARMRASVGEADIVVTAVVDRSVRDAAKRFVGEGDSLFDGVRGVAVALDTSSKARVRAQVWCDSAAACEAVQAGLEARRVTMAASLALRAAGVAGVFDGARIDRREAMVELQVEADASRVVELVERISKWSEEERAPVRAPSPPGTAPVPNEVLSAPPAAGAPAGSK